MKLTHTVRPAILLKVSDALRPGLAVRLNLNLRTCSAQSQASYLLASDQSNCARFVGRLPADKGCRSDGEMEPALPGAAGPVVIQGSADWTGLGIMMKH